MKQKDSKQEVRALEQRIKDLKHEQEIGNLNREIEFMKKGFEVEKDAIGLECKKNEIEATADLKQAVASKTARIEELKVRLEEGPYTQLSEILKALVVKLPTLNISELAVSTKEK